MSKSYKKKGEPDALARSWGFTSSSASASSSPPDHNSKELVCTTTGAKPRFLADDESFAIWNAVSKLNDEERQVVIQGPIARVSSGEMLSCQGKWQKHPQHGWSFKVEDYTSALPQNPEGVSAWLSSRVDGVGPQFANAIVDHFGFDKVFDILDEDPSKLHQVKTKKGRQLPEKQVKKAVEAWEGSKAIRQIETFLFSFGVTANMADRLYRNYGAGVIDILKEEPYKITEMRGIGFKNADKIARKMGIPLDDPHRIKAGIMFSLEEGEGEGNVYLSLQNLLGKSQTILGFSNPKKIVTGASVLVEEGRIVAEADQVLQQRVYSKRIHRIETRLAREIREMMTTPRGSLFPKPPRPEAPEGISQKELEKLKLPTDEQWSVVELVRENRLSILTGNPGTGKSWSQETLVNLAKKHDLKIRLCAPTGKAARRMQELTHHPATTIHRLLEFSPFEGGFQRDETNPIDADLIILDEASMLSLDLADSFIRAVGAHTHLLLVGDPDQLPPVGVGKVFADLIASQVVPRVHLSQIFRQASRSMIIQNSRRINNGKLPYLKQEEAERVLQQKMLNDFYWVTRSKPEDTFELCIDFAVNRIPRVFGFDPKTEIMVLAPMRKGKVGLEVLNQTLEERLNPPEKGKEKIKVLPKRGIYVGSRIVQTKNYYGKDDDEDRSVMNGEIAIVKDYNKTTEEALLSLDDGDRELWFHTQDMDTYFLAWAMSIHKSQGSQFPAIVSPVSTAHYQMLSRSLAYTAITRAEKLCVMVGENKALHMAISKIDTDKRNSTLAARIVDSSLSGELF